jgi:hypothetical protein
VILTVGTAKGIAVILIMFLRKDLTEDKENFNLLVKSEFLKTNSK